MIYGEEISCKSIMTVMMSNVRFHHRFPNFITQEILLYDCMQFNRTGKRTVKVSGNTLTRLGLESLGMTEPPLLDGRFTDTDPLTGTKTCFVLSFGDSSSSFTPKRVRSFCLLSL